MNTYETVCDVLGVKYLETVSDRRGSVLLKVQETDGTIVALKGYDQTSPDAEERHELLRREAEQLKHIGDLLDEPLLHEYCRTSSQGDWLAMRWLDGLNAKQYADSVTDRSDRVERLIELFRGLARQLGTIHDAGYLHGDIQPAHVIICYDMPANPVILDWGLARHVDDASTSYKGALVHYAAPEIAAGMLQSRSDIEYTRAAEIYSLGATMYFCLFGETPVWYALGAPFEDKIRAVAAGELRHRIRSGNERLLRLEAVIAVCLAFNPAERYESLHKLDSALAALQ